MENSIENTKRTNLAANNTVEYRFSDKCPIYVCA